ncbi:hypothetical protein [Thermoproteus tenax]|uniref:Uncharacterized protein n=1 Tax=Thermoproteus tenax (strain ATCC 35583 / DSM 2078 / JCM 9277 / NBRC 100435 / Kra 1) TaxID=768679 RepID=G4RN64_THETK|nr:hypothetical protein [Thermoproteus tenax]CCC81008.1 hypothetical protein TTX_0332 [Thermoproteus tenax Kra 1]
MNKALVAAAVILAAAAVAAILMRTAPAAPPKFSQLASQGMNSTFTAKYKLDIEMTEGAVSQSLAASAVYSQSGSLRLFLAMSTSAGPSGRAVFYLATMPSDGGLELCYLTSAPLGVWLGGCRQLGPSSVAELQSAKARALSLMDNITSYEGQRTVSGYTAYCYAVKGNITSDELSYILVLPLPSARELRIPYVAQVNGTVCLSSSGAPLYEDVAVTPTIKLLLMPPPTVKVVVEALQYQPGVFLSENATWVINRASSLSTSS